MDIVEKISGVPLFRDLSLKIKKELSLTAILQNYEKGQLIFSEGDDGCGFYVIISGSVKIFKLSPEGKEQILHIMEPGEPFGEVAVFAGQPFPASAQALSASKVLFFPRKAFIELITKSPELSLNMLAFLSRRLRVLAGLVENLSLKEVPGRLAAYLLSAAQNKTDPAILELDISKNQLAALLGTIPETLSRILNRMGKDKLIKSSAHNIQILDRQALIDLSEGKRRLS